MFKSSVYIMVLNKLIGLFLNLRISLLKRLTDFLINKSITKHIDKIMSYETITLTVKHCIRGLE